MAKENTQISSSFKNYILQELQTLKQVLTEKLKTIENSHSQAELSEIPTLVEKKVNCLRQVEAIDRLCFLLQRESNPAIDVISKLLKKAKTNLKTRILFKPLDSL